MKDVLRTIFCRTCLATTESVALQLHEGHVTLLDIFVQDVLQRLNLLCCSYMKEVLQLAMF